MSISSPPKFIKDAWRRLSTNSRSSQVGSRQNSADASPVRIELKKQLTSEGRRTSNEATASPVRLRLNKQMAVEEDILTHSSPERSPSPYDLESSLFRKRCNTAGDAIKSIKDFEKLCTIGTGTFGRVLLVKRKHTVDFYALKIMSIRAVIKAKQVEHVHSEKEVLECLEHPFIITMYWAYHDSKCIYMLFDFVPGGELFSYLRAAGKFGNNTARFYAAEIISAIAYMHSKGIVYRDLKPENLLLDKDGHLKITDFGFAKHLNDRTWTLCGTPEYLAPEVIDNRGHNKAVDWWGLGVLIYEMLAGFPPFYGDNPLEIYEKILEGRYKFPRSFNLVAKDLVKKLVQPDRTLRLGNMKAGAEDIKNHKWFRSLDWDDVHNKKLHPPIVPTVYGEGDTGNFDEYEEKEIDDAPEAGETEVELFKDFEMNPPVSTTATFYCKTSNSDS